MLDARLVEGRGQRDEGNPDLRREIHIFRREKSKPNPNPSQIRASSSKACPNSSQENPWISFAESSLIKELRRPPRPFFFCAPISPSRRPGGSAGAARPPSVVPFRLHFRVLRSRGQVKGWRHFDRERLGGDSADLPAASLTKANRGNPRVLGLVSETEVRKKRAIDPTSGKNSSAPRARSGSSLWRGRAPALHAFRSISRTLPLLIPSVSLIARRMRPLSVGRVENAFHPAMSYHSEISEFCKEFALKI